MTEPIGSGDIDASYKAKDRLGVASVELDGEVVLYDAEMSKSHVLSPTAGLIWQFLDGSDTLAAIAADIADALGADADTVLDDVIATTRQFGRKGLLEGVTAEEPLDGETA